MASLNDSKVFAMLNKSSNLTTKIGKIISTGLVMDRSYIEEQYLQITKTRISPIAGKVLQAFDEGRIRLIWNKNMHGTIALPFVVVQIGGKPTACIFIADFGTTNKEGDALTIEMKKLYVLMESAYVGLQYFTTPEKFSKVGPFIKMTAHIYAEMWLRILNREYALSLDKDLYDMINYACGRFFIARVLGLKNEDLADSYATSICKTPTESNMRLAADFYNQSNPESAEVLISLIKNTNTKMSDLKYRYFFERWISSYGTGACLAIDSFPYFYYVLANVLIGGFLINVTGLSTLVKETSGISGFYGIIDRFV